MPQIYDMGPTALLPLPKEGMLRIFFALKNPKASAGFEPANLGTKGQHATPRPPKLKIQSNWIKRRERDWIFCVVISECYYNRGV